MIDVTPMRRHRLEWALVCALLGGGTAQAADAEFAYSGFGTVGYARSDRSYTYDRYIDDSGTFRRDSVVGLQIDAKAFDQFGATVQVKVAPSTNHDRRYEGSVSWAFVSFRPTNDWLFRVGKQRIPFYLYSETVDVGVSYDFARLPIEMYSIAPSNDFVGVQLRRTFRVADGDFSIDGFYGRSSNDFRTWIRDDIPQVASRGEAYTRLIFKGGSLAVSYRDHDKFFRLGITRAIIRRDHNEPIASGFDFVTVFPGVGYYQVSDALPGPGVPMTNAVVNTLVTFGADFVLPGAVRVNAEFARATVPGGEGAPKGNRGYLALLRPVGRWTPYVSYAFLKSPAGQLEKYSHINDNTVPAFIPGSQTINSVQRLGADLVSVYDQHSWAVGTSYSLSPTSKLKAEFLGTHVGQASQLVDAAPGMTPRNLSIRTFSASYSVVFQ